MVRSTLNPDRELSSQAAQWMVRLMADEEMSEAEHREFWCWLTAEPRHEEAFGVQTDLWVAIGDLDREFVTRQLAWLDTSIDKERRQRVWRRIGGFSLAAGIVFAALLGGWLYLRAQGLISATYTTRVGEIRSVQLADGSVAQLNTQTRLRWIAERGSRRLVLLDGEALFNVAHNPARPFRVEVGGLAIRVLGTQFNVYRKPDQDIVITVLNGAVEVRESVTKGASPWRKVVQKDQRLVYPHTGQNRDIQTVVARNVIQWPQGLLDVDDQPLIDVVGELTRYTHKHIRISDPALWQVRITGAVNTHRVRDSLVLLQEHVPFRVTETRDAFILSYRPQPAALIASPNSTALPTLPAHR